MKVSKLVMLSLALAVVALTGLAARADAPLVSVTGTVVSRDGDVLVVQTPNGNLTFDIDKSTDMPPSLPVGSKITVWYDSDDKPEDKMDARRITMFTESGVTTPPPAATQPAPVTTQPAPAAQTEVTTEERTELPSTASPLPLVGGTGILALMTGGLFMLRARRK